MRPPISRKFWICLLLLSGLVATVRADPARGTQKWGLGVEGLGRTIAGGAFVDYCVFPRLAIGGGYGILRAQSYVNGSLNSSSSLVTAYANFYFTGMYWAGYATFGALFSIPSDPNLGNPLLPGIGLEYRAHWGLLFRAALYLVTDTNVQGPLATPIGTFWPGVSLGIALWPGHAS
jgi:hypothetical protein